MKKNLLLLQSDPLHPRKSEGAFLKLDDGRLIYAYSRYSGGGWRDDDPCDIVSRESPDDGENWSEEDQLLVAHNDAQNVMSVSFLRLHSRRILLFYLRKCRRRNRVPVCMPMVKTSEDDGVTWSEARPVIPFPGWFVLNNDRVIQLANGRILVPVAWHRPLNLTDNSSAAITLIYCSDDEGESFYEAANWILPEQESVSGLQEPAVVEAAPGKLLCFMRTDAGHQMVSRSSDDGMHWSRPEVSEFASPLSPLSIKKNDFNGRLYAVWNDISHRGDYLESSWGRTPLVIASSADQGQSWEHRDVLEDDPGRGYCYTSMYFRPDALLLAYCCGGREGKVVLQESKLVKYCR